MDCDIYKKIVGNNYDEELEEVNGNCCELKKVKCDLHNNITYASFSSISCNFEILFEQLPNLLKLQEAYIILEDQPIPSSIQKLTQIKKLTIHYSRTNKNYYDIPKIIGNLVNLEELDLSESHFAGKIPNEFGKLVNLRILDLHENILEGYVPYEFKNLTNLEYLDLSNNHLEGFVPPIQGLTTCRIKDNSNMCYLKSSRCRTDIDECTLDEIRTTNNNNGNPNPKSGEFENEKETFKTNNNNYSIVFIISIVIGITVIAVIFFAVIRCFGKRKHKFSKFDNDNNDNNINNGNINNIAYNITTAANPQPVSYGYNYGPEQPVAPTIPIYYPVPSPVPAATQPLTYIPPNPAIPYNAMPTSQPELSYGNPIQPPSQSSTYISPQKEVANQPVNAQPVNAQPVDVQPIEISPEMDNNLPPPLLEEQEHSPYDVLPPYESLSRSLGRPQ